MDHCHRSGATGYFERCRSRFIIPEQARSSELTVCEFEAERGHIRTADHHSRIFSGPPPAEWYEGLEPLPVDDEANAIKTALATLVEQCSDRVRLQYSAIASRRVTVSSTLSSPMRFMSAWAITGWLEPTRPGATQPLGWSGRGNGLDWIRNQAAEELRAMSERLERAEMIEPANTPAVLSPSASAVLLHEVIGHSAEAAPDCRLNHNRHCGYRVASEILSLMDDPLARGGSVNYEYDDDNVRCLGPTPVVDEGIMVAQLHSQSTAAAAGTLPTANGRAASVWDLPIPRVSNLICGPGSRSEDELIDGLGDGLYIKRLANGINNGAIIEAEIVLAEKIEKGKRSGKFVTSGHIHEDMRVLLRATAAADNPAFNSNAICGKAGQLLFNVGTFAPSISLSSLRVLA
jgi:predicted Zn-dependent protease